VEPRDVGHDQNGQHRNEAANARPIHGQKKDRDENHEPAPRWHTKEGHQHEGHDARAGAGNVQRVGRERLEVSEQLRRSLSEARKDHH
jgi:hypothetical protein